MCAESPLTRLCGTEPMYLGLQSWHMDSQSPVRNRQTLRAQRSQAWAEYKQPLTTSQL